MVESEPTTAPWIGQAGMVEAVHVDYRISTRSDSGEAGQRWTDPSRSQKTV